MRDWLFLQLLVVSITAIPVILLLKLLANKLSRAYVAQWKYWMWLVLAVRMLIPWSPELPMRSVEITIPESSVGVEADEQTITLPREELQMSIPEPSEYQEKISEQPQMMEQQKVPAKEAASIPPLDRGDALVVAELLWITVAVGYLAYHIIVNCVAGRRLRRWSRPADSALISRLSEIVGESGIPKGLRILVNSRISGPMVMGLFQPKLYLPERDYESEDLQYVLLHELTHYRRKDLWYKALLLVVNGVHWFNPFVYLMCREAQKDLECSCDSMVMNGAEREERRSYANLILDTAAYQEVSRGVLASNFYGGKGDLKMRIQNIFDTGKKKKGTFVFSVLTGVAIIISGLWGVTMEQSEASQQVAVQTREETADQKEEASDSRQLVQTVGSKKSFEDPIAFLDENLVQNVDKSLNITDVSLGTGDYGWVSAWKKEGVTEPFYELEYGKDIHYEIEDGVLKCVVELYQGASFYRGIAELPYVYENGKYVIDRDRTMLYLDWEIDTAARNSLWQHSQMMEELDGLHLDGRGEEDRLTLHRVVDGSVAHNVLTVYLDNGLTASYKLPSNHVTMNDDSHVYKLPMQSDYYQTIIVQLSDPDISRLEASVDYYILHVEVDEESQTAQIVEDVAILDGMMDSENYPQHQDTFLEMPFYNVTHYGDNGIYYHKDLEKVTLCVTGLTEEEVCYVYWDGEAWKTYTE